MAISLRREEESPQPTVRIRTPAGTARVLRRHFRLHNLRVTGLALGTLVGCVAAWGVLYMAAWWALAFFVGIINPEWVFPQHAFTILFATVALSATAYTWIDNYVTPNALPSDKKSIGEITGEFLLLVPNMTLSIVGTLRAWTSLRRGEYEQAAALLHRLGAEKRVPMSGVRLQIPDPDAAMRVLFALQMTEIIEVHRTENELWLKLNALRPAALRLSAHDLTDASHGV